MDVWRDFLDEVDAARAELGLGEEEDTWFRGHSSSDWPLLPSLFRVAKETEVPDLEADLFYEFSAKARELHSARLDSWETLFIMRHHGVATRLLDWTEQFGTALYFALRGWDAGASPDRPLPAIWILNPFRLNEDQYAWGGPYLIAPRNLFDRCEEMEGYVGIEEYVDVLSYRKPWPYLKPIAIYPRQVSTRQQAQSGWFTIHGSDHRPLDQIASSTVVRRLELTPEVIVEGKKFLARAGFNEYLMFPDLDGLARSLHEKYIERPAAARARADAVRAAKKRRAARARKS